MSRFVLLLALLPLCLTSCGKRQLQPVISDHWAEMTVSATGRGAFPQNAGSQAQALVMAERAAKQDAFQKLAEEVYGLRLRSQTSVQDAVLADDRIDTELRAFIQSARILQVRQRPELGIVEVDVELLLGRRFEEILFRR